MKKLLVITMALLLAVMGVFAQTKIGQQGPKSAAVVYTCPMHPEVVSDKPGKCPKCGMTLVVKKSTVKKPAASGKKDSTSMKGMKMNGMKM